MGAAEGARCQAGTALDRAVSGVCQQERTRLPSACPLRRGAGGSTLEVYGQSARASGPRLLWMLFMEGMCLQLQIPTEKDKGNRWGEIPGPHFSCYSCGLKPLNLARLPREGFYKAHCPFPKSPRTPAPTCSFCLPFFPSSPPEKCSLGQSGRPQPGPEDFCPLLSRTWDGCSQVPEGWGHFPEIVWHQAFPRTAWRQSRPLDQAGDCPSNRSLTD